METRNTERNPTKQTSTQPIDFGVSPPLCSADSIFTIQNMAANALLLTSIVDDNSQGRFKVLSLKSYNARGKENATGQHDRDRTNLFDATDGARPLKVSRGQQVDIALRFFSLGSKAQDTFSATLVIQDAGAEQEPMEVRMSAQVAQITTKLPRSVRITAGQRLSVPITIISDAGPDTTVSYKVRSRRGGISNTPLQVSLPKGARVTATLELIAAPNAPPGEHNLTVESTAFSGKLITVNEVSTIVLSPRPPPIDVCQSFENLSQSWSRNDQTWSNWGIVDSNTTLLGFLPTPRLFRPTNLYEVAHAIKQAEAANTTIRALGSGWSFSDAVLPQTSPMEGGEGATVRTRGLAGELDEADLASASSSFSRHFGYAIDTSMLDRSLQALLPSVLAANRNIDALFFAEAGMTINFLNTLLDSQVPPLALKTMGGSSGQTIAGAFSTGTHGSDFDRPPLVDNVRAIYLVGAGAIHHWIEPSNPLTDPLKIQLTFPCIAAENIHYDDDIFHATLVSMGAMGVIYAVILDVVPQYSLLQYNEWSTWEDLKAAIAPDFLGLFDGTFTGLAGHLRERLQTENPPPPRFAQIVINPIRNESDGKHNCYVSNRVELALQEPGGLKPLANYTDIDAEEVMDAIRNSPEFGFNEMIHFLDAQEHGELGSEGEPLLESLPKVLAFLKRKNYPWAVHAVIDRVMQLSFPRPGSPANPQVDIGFKIMAPGGTSRAFPTLGATSVEPSFSFYRTIPSPDQPGLQIVVPDVVSIIDRVLTAIDQGVDEDKMFPAGWLSLRVTGRTSALLGMQRFDRSGMLEVSLIGTSDDYAVVRRVEQLAHEEGGALHWGQSNGLMTFSDLEFAYLPSSINKWRSAQQALGGNTFTNYFMRRCGLIPSPILRVNPASIRFGVVPVGDTSQPKTLRIHNDGSGELVLSLADSRTIFVWTGLSSVVIPPGGSRVIEVEFSPQSDGPAAAMLVLQSNAPGSPHGVPLSGAGTEERLPQ